MVCTITSTANKAPIRGMTLVEVLLASAVGLTITTMVGSFSLFNARSVVALGNYIEMNNRSRPALDLMCADIRQANGCSTNNLSPVQLTLVGTNAGNLLPYTLLYKYDARARTLSRTYTDASVSQTRVLLTECNTFSLAYFQRTPISGTYDVYAINDPGRPDLCKLIQITWSCSRKILDKAINTENLQSARVVIRKG